MALALSDDLRECRRWPVLALAALAIVGMLWPAPRRRGEQP